MCGIAGAYNVPNPYDAVIGMIDSLPHRGENGAGFALGNNDGSIIRDRTEFDLPNLIRKTIDLSRDNLGYCCGISHRRYGTAGDRRSLDDAQPFVAEMPWQNGQVCLAHNGDSPFMDEDRNELLKKGAVFSTSSDSELMLHYIARSGAHDPITAIRQGLKKYRGTFALAMLVRDGDGIKLVAARDSSGNRPLSLGKIGPGYVIASENSAFQRARATYERDILPNELLVISKDGPSQYSIADHDELRPLKQCNYELDYFSLPTSRTFGIPVSEYRLAIGQLAAKRLGHLIKPGDIITYVPDSAKFFAEGFCKAINRELATLIIRLHSTRSFIQESLVVVEDTLRRKFSFMLDEVDKILKSNPKARLWVIDDSIVRGSTSRKIIRAFRDMGFSWIGWVSAISPLIGPCHKGIDMPGKEGKLIAAKFIKDGDITPDCQMIASDIEANFVGYLPLTDMYDLIRTFGKNPDDFCFGCFENRDPVWEKW